MSSTVGAGSGKMSRSEEGWTLGEFGNLTPGPDPWASLEATSFTSTVTWATLQASGLEACLLARPQGRIISRRQRL